MPRLHYAHPADVIRKYNPQLTLGTLESQGYIGNDDVEKLTSRLEAVESKFDSLTSRPLREVQVGTPGHPQTYEHQEAEMYRTEYGVKVWLDNQNLQPIDPQEGDVIEVRKGKDAWDDVTGQEGSRWEADYEKGWIRIFSRYRRTAHRRQLRDKFLRICYRHGARGGRYTEAGQTTLAVEAQLGDTTLEVEDASRLPREGVVFVDGEEYVVITDRNLDADELTVQRGVRGTDDGVRSAGSVVHYMPLDVREAVAAKAAVELLQYEEWVDELVESGGYSVRDKMEQWEQDWQETLAKFSGVRSV